MQKPLQLSLYWKCQLIGWSLASLYWGYTGYLGKEFRFLIALIHFIGDVGLYILITHAFRSFSLKNRWQLLPPGKLLFRLAPAVLVMAALFLAATTLKLYAVRLWTMPGYAETFGQFFQSNWLAVFVAGMRLMSIWLLAYYGYHYAQREIRVTKENARLSVMATEAQLNNLSSQLNPHFFFNCLNSIKALVLVDPLAARRAIDLLADLMRNALYKNGTALVPLEKELALITDYLELEKIRLETRLHTSIQVAEGLSNAHILPLSIQALVENAIKHGIALRKEGGTVTIQVERLPNHLYINVTNSGNLNNSNGAGLGLRNLRERLQLQFRGDASFNLLQQDGTVVATLITPLVWTAAG